LRAYEAAEQAISMAEMPNEERLALANWERVIRERGSAAGDDNVDPAVQEDFRAFQACLRTETERLLVLMSRCLEKYTIMSARWEPLARMPDIGMGLRQAVPQSVLECSVEDRPHVGNDYLNKLYADAGVVFQPFFKEVQRCVESLNAAKLPKELGLDEEQWPFLLRRREHQKATLLPCCWLRLGPLKDRLRSEYKIAADYGGCAWPQAAHLLDIVRCAVAFDDPYALLAFAEYLGTQMQISRVKNRFRSFVPGETVSQGSTPESEYRDLLLNIEFTTRGTTHILEIQLALRDLAELKRWSHKPYKVERMADYQHLLYVEVFTQNCEHHPVRC